MQQERARVRQRADRLAQLQGGRGAAWLLRLLRRAWLRTGHLVADHSRSALILAVFAFKVGDGGRVQGGRREGDWRAAWSAARMLCMPVIEFILS